MEFKELVLGTVSFQWYLAAFFFSFLALFVRWAVKTNNGIKFNLESPDTFSWKYWIENNLITKLKSIGLTVAVVFLCLRFASDWFGIVPSMAFAAGIGLAFDWVLDYIKKRTKGSPVDPSDDSHLMS